MTIRIPDGNAFRIRLTARNLITGEYTEAADLSNIDNLVINYVRRGIRFPHAYTIDEEGRATVADAGTLDCGFYGIELTGYYGGEKFRFYGKDLFEITTDTTDVIDPSNLIDIEITVKLNASGVSKDYVDHAINGMETSMETMQADLRDEIAEAGKVDDVKVNGVSVVFGKKANITVPTKVSDLQNDSSFQNATQVQQKVDAAKITAVDISVDGGTGTPSGTAAVSNNRLVIALHNIKGETGEQGQSIEGPAGPQGASAVFDPNTGNILATMENALGQSDMNAMTQKAVTNEILSDRIWGMEALSITYTGSGVTLRYLKQVTVTDPDTQESVTKWKWEGNTSYYAAVVIAVTPGRTYRILASANKASRYAFLKVKNNDSASNYAEFADGCAITAIATGTEAFVTAPPDAYYMYIMRTNSGDCKPQSVSLVEYTKEHISEIENECEGHAQEIQQLNDNDIHRLEQISLPSTASGTGLYYITAALNWDSNTIYYSGLVIEVEPGEKYKIVPPEGNRVRFTFLKNNSRSGNLTTNQQFAQGYDNIVYGAIDEALYVTAPEDAHYIYLNRNGYTAKTPAFFGKVISVNDAITILEGGASAIEKETLALIKHAAYKREGSDSATSLPYFKLLHYSDIHASGLAAEKILMAINALSPYLDDVLNTGDVVNAIVGSGAAYNGENFYPNSGLQDKSLFTLGNHDDLLSVEQGTRQDKAWSHDLYFPASIITALGITMPTGYDDSSSPNYKACYWHKDYTAQKVRLIGLDCRNKCDGVVDPETGAVTTQGNTGNEQEAWLAARLAETLPDSGNAAAGYTVIIAGHYPLDGYDIDTNGENKQWDDNAHEWVCNHKSTGGRVINQTTGEVSNWHRYGAVLNEANASMRWSNASNHNNFGEIIKYYMEEGMSFAAFLCGHTHNNLFFYPTKYPDILNVCIDMAGELRNMSYANQATMGGYIANFISFSTSSKIMKIVRLGVRNDVYLRPLNYLSYNYESRKIISEG